MKIFDLYRAGFELGSAHAQAGQRRRAKWELAVFHPVTWLPGVDTDSFNEGYIQGYHDSSAIRAIIRLNGD